MQDLGRLLYSMATQGQLLADEEIKAGKHHQIPDYFT